MDESGKPNPKDPEKEYALAALTIHESEHKQIENELSEIKLRYFPNSNPDEVEIHATDIMSRKGAFKNMEVNERTNLLKDVLSILHNSTAVINCVVIRKDMLSPYATIIDDIAYKYLFERLCMTHKELNNSLKGSNPQYGILFMDSIQPKFDKQIKSNVRQLIKKGTEYTDNQYIIEDVVFVDSKYRAMSQLIDCVAYTIRRYMHISFHDPKRLELEFYKDCFDIIRPHIRKNSGKIEGVGLKIYPK